MAAERAADAARLYTRLTVPRRAARLRARLAGGAGPEHSSAELRRPEMDLLAEAAQPLQRYPTAPDR